MMFVVMLSECGWCNSRLVEIRLSLVSVSVGCRLLVKCVLSVVSSGLSNWLRVKLVVSWLVLCCGVCGVSLWVYCIISCMLVRNGRLVSIIFRVSLLIFGSR